MPSSPCGFTLIELLVVLMILGLAAAIVFPRLSDDVLGRTKLRTTVNKIASTATFAHDQAASSGAMHTLHIDIEEGTYWVTSERPVDKTESGSRRRMLHGHLPDGIQFQSVEIPGKISSVDEDEVVEIRFSPEGWADSAAIYVAGPEDEINTILISGRLGRIETYDSQVEEDGKD